jgi:FkbM family methyltransferase
VIDIGSGIGEFAIMTAGERPNCQIYAYEPFPESFALLQENLALNKTANVHAFQIAVGATSGQMTLATTGEAVQHTTTGSDVSGNATSFIDVQGLSFEELFEANGITRCHFLKIDCEGCEFELLFSASPATLAKIDHICMEYHNGFTEHTHTELAKHLEAHGFQTKVTPNPVHDFLGFMHAYR